MQTEDQITSEQQKILQNLHSTLNFDVVIKYAFSLLNGVFPFDVVAIHFLDKKKQHFTFYKSIENSAEENYLAQLPESYKNFHFSFQSEHLSPNKLLVFDDVSKESEWDSYNNFWLSTEFSLLHKFYPFNLAVFFPIEVEGEIVGCLNTFSHFSMEATREKTISELERCLTMMTPAIHNAWLYTELRFKKESFAREKRSLNRTLKKVLLQERKTNLLNRMMQSVNVTLDLEEVLKALKEILKEQKYLFEGICLHLKDDDNNCLFLVDILSITGENIDDVMDILNSFSIPLERNSGIFADVCHMMEPLYQYQTTEEIMSAPVDKKYFDLLPFNTLLLFPLMAQGEVFGVLTFFTTGIHLRLEEKHIEDIQGYVDHTTSSIRNAQLYMNLQKARDKIDKHTQELFDEHERLKRTQAQLVQSEKMASLGTLVAGVAHELNNPNNFLNVGTLNLETNLNKFREFLFSLIEDDQDAEIHEAFNEHFEKVFNTIDSIQHGSRRIQTIVTGLRTFSRLDESDYKSVNIIDSLQSALALVRANYDQQVDFVCQFPEEIYVECWAAEINQVFMNLMVNGCQAIVAKQKQNGNSIPGKFTLNTSQTDGYLNINFQDTGCGMTSEVQNKMFEPFFTTKEVGSGTGLGLAMVFGILEKHNAKITVNSVLGEGTKITISLPYH